MKSNNNFRNHSKVSNYEYFPENKYSYFNIRLIAFLRCATPAIY